MVFQSYSLKDFHQLLLYCSVCSKSYKKIQAPIPLMRYILFSCLFSTCSNLLKKTIFGINISGLLNILFIKVYDKNYIWTSLFWFVSFEQILYCNIGNPQSLGQQPVTFFREVGFFYTIWRGGSYYLSPFVCLAYLYFILFYFTGSFFMQSSSYLRPRWNSWLV